VFFVNEEPTFVYAVFLQAESSEDFPRVIFGFWLQDDIVYFTIFID